MYIESILTQLLNLQYTGDTVYGLVPHTIYLPTSGKEKRSNGRGGIRTHAIEMTGALNQRLRPLGHPTKHT